MEKERIRNIKVSKKVAKLIGTVVLVDSLIVGLFTLGGHTPIYRDDKNLPEVTETIYVDYPDWHDVETTNYYYNQMDKRSKVIYYKKPYTIGKEKYREIETVIKDPTGPIRDVKTVRVSPAMPDDDTYVETYVYDIDTNNYITVKETLHDELLSDTCLLMILGVIDTGMICAGNSFIKRKEEEEKELLKS